MDAMAVPSMDSVGVGHREEAARSWFPHRFRVAWPKPHVWHRELPFLDGDQIYVLEGLYFYRGEYVVSAAASAQRVEDWMRGYPKKTTAPATRTRSTAAERRTLIEQHPWVLDYIVGGKSSHLRASETEDMGNDDETEFSNTLEGVLTDVWASFDAPPC